MTTNGSQLATTAQQLKQAHVARLNISLDTLNAQKFTKLTRTGDLETVLKGIHTAVNTGFQAIKINAVILKIAMTMKSLTWFYLPRIWVSILALLKKCH